jgi:hypothetical protein
MAQVMAFRACGRLNVRKANGGSISKMVSGKAAPASKAVNREGRDAREELSSS